MPLRVDTDTHRHTHTNWYTNKNDFKKPGACGLWPRAPGVKRCGIKMGNQGLLMLMELKFLIIMARLQNISVACQLLEVIVAGNSNVCNLVCHHYQILFYQQQVAFGCPFWFFSQHGLFKFLTTTFLHYGCFGWNFISFYMFFLVFLLKFAL